MSPQAATPRRALPVYVRRLLRLPDDRAIPRQYALSILFLIVGTFLASVTTEKTTFLYKEMLHLSASDIATLNLFLAIPVYIQPFLAAFTELVPWLGYRRRSYFALGVIVAGLGYAWLALLPRYTYQTFVPLMLVIATGATLRSIVINAVYAAVGNRTGILARLQTVLTIISLTLSLTYTSHLGGFVAAHWSYKAVFLVAAALTLLKLPLMWLIPDPRVASIGAGDGSTISAAEVALARTRHAEQQRAERRGTMRILRTTARDRRFWAAIGLIAFIGLTPFPGSALIYYEVDFLHFSKQFVGDLNAYNSAGSVAGLVIFYLLGKRLRLRVLPYLYVGLNAVIYVFFLCMRDALSAKLCFAATGAVSVFLTVAGTIFAARLCPRGAEGTVFAFYATVSTLFTLLCDKWGTFLYDHYGPANTSAHYTVINGWNVSLYVGLGMTILAFGFIPFLPHWAHSSAPLSAPAAEYETEPAADPITPEVTEI